jgi:hypothetical protein
MDNITSQNVKTSMTQEAASRIQSDADRTGTNQDFKARAQSAATRNEKCSWCQKEYPADQAPVNIYLSDYRQLKNICPDCFKRFFNKTKCHMCNKEFYSPTIPKEEICRSCFNQHYSVCPECDTIFNKDNWPYQYCKSCQQRLQGSQYDYDDDEDDD